MDCIVHWVTKSWTWPSNFHFDKAALCKGIHITSRFGRFFRSRNWQFLRPWHLCLLFSSLCSVWTEEAQCTLLNASITETFNCSFSCGPDCWKLSQYPCLQVYVNLTSSGEKLLLYHTEETIKINQKVGAWHTLHLIHPHVAPRQSISLCL